MAKPIVISPDDLPQVLKEFWSNVTKTDGCWKWQDGKYPKYYGSFRYNGQNYRANRLIWVALNGPIPEGLFVLHKCDNPPCVRPDHLFLGTQSDNMKDCARKGRFWGQKYPDKTTIKTIRVEYHGEQIGTSKLTTANVLEIRSIGTSIPATVLARKFKVDRATIVRVIRRENWRHVK